MSKVSVDRELLAGLVSNDRATRLDAERRMYGVLVNQPAEAEGVGRWSELKLLAEAAAGFDYEFDWMTKEVSSLRRAATPQAILELIAALSAVTAENDRLRAGVAGDFDLDAWLDWAKEAERLRAEVEGLRKALEQYADDRNWCYDTCNISRDIAKAALAAKEA